MEAAASAVRVGRVSTFAAPVGIAACAVTAVAVLVAAGTPETTYAGASAAARVCDVAAGAALLLAAFLTSLEPRTRRLAGLAALAALAWFGPHWEGWDQGPPFVRSLGALLAPLLLPLLIQLVLAGVHTRLARSTIGAAYAVTTAVVVGRALLADPSLDVYCWRNCTDNVFLVHPDLDVGRALDDAWLRVALALGLVIGLASVWRLLTATRPARRALGPILVPAVLVGAAETSYAVALLVDPLEDPADPSYASLFVGRALALVALGAGITWSFVHNRRTRAAVARLATDLGGGPPPGDVRDALASALGDPQLELVYRLGQSETFVDGEGKRVDEPRPARGRTPTPILRDGTPIAVVVHDGAAVDGARLGREIGPAARLAVENERLHAEVLAQLHDLRASRNRVVETGDAERRRLERDLHDGAQQRLLAISYELRLARAGAGGEGDAELAGLLDAAVDESRSALAELRELAHGIFPAVLVEAGLRAALETLADSAPLPVELGALPDERYPPAAEAAAYIAAADAVADAARRGATFVAVEARGDGASLVVTAADDGRRRDSCLVHVADRVGALGGTVEAGPAGVRVTIPCA